MKRRSFIKKSSLSGLALAVFPKLPFSTFKIDAQELMGKSQPKLFGDNFKLLKEAHDSFLKMRTKALNAGINIQVVSSYRGFDHQNRIWKRKFSSYTNKGLSVSEAINKIIEYSTIPGTSRHHWGTDLDIIDGNPKQPDNVLLARHFIEKGPYSKLKKWMDEHANSFGFYLVYTDIETRKGFKYEPWHYTYKPLSDTYLQEFLKLDILELLKKEDILGKEKFTEEFMITYINNHILDINPKLLH